MYFYVFSSAFSCLRTIGDLGTDKHGPWVPKAHCFEKESYPTRSDPTEELLINNVLKKLVSMIER